jgi:DNA polymerase III delta subunit
MIHVIEGNDQDLSREKRTSLLSGCEFVEDIDCSIDGGMSLFEAVASLSMFGERRVIHAVSLESITEEWARKIAGVESDALVVGSCQKMPSGVWKHLSKVAQKHDATTSKTTVTARISSIARDSGVHLDRESVSLLALLGVDGLSRVRSVCWQLATVGISRPTFRQVKTLLGEVQRDGVPWGVTDSLDRGDVRGALGQDSEVFPLISYLYNEYSRAARVCESEARTEGSVKELLGCTPPQARKALERANKLGSERIRSVLLAVAKAETRSKDGTGEDAARDLLISEIAAIEGWVPGD